MRGLDRQVMRVAFDVHNDLGRLCDEYIYKKCLGNRLVDAGLPVVTELPIDVAFGEFSRKLSIDVVVHNAVLYELKAVSSLTRAHESQLLTYMMLVRSNRGKLVNFRSDRVESIFVNVCLTWEERHQYEIDNEFWTGSRDFAEMVVMLIADWGTCLSTSLYMDALVANLGGADRVEHRLPLRVEGRFVGHQRFRLFDPKSAIALTAFEPDNLPVQQSHLCRILNLTKLASIYWVNVGRHRLTLKTLSR